MPNYKLIFSVTLIVVIFGYAHGQLDYDAIRKEAADCIAGDRIRHDCNRCDCVKKGIMICTTHLCGFKRPETKLSTQPPSYTGPNYQKGLGNRIKLEEWTRKWKKFFEETASCKLGERRKDPYDCNWCECLSPGSMICETTNKCSKKTEVTLSASPSSSQSIRLSIKTPEGLQRWKKFSEAAASCTKGDSTRDPDGCNTCDCIENGVMICSRMACGKKTGIFPPNRLSKKEINKMKTSSHHSQSLKHFAENAAECTVGDRMKDYNNCNWCECVETGVMICSKKGCAAKSKKGPSSFVPDKDSAMIVTATNTKLHVKDYYNLRDKTKNCIPDGTKINSGCHVCKCIRCGVMKCVGIKGSPCDKNTKAKKSPMMKLDLPADNKAKDCIPDGTTINSGCHVCKCVRHGAMKCVGIKGSPCDKNTTSKESPITMVDLPADSDYLYGIY